MHTMPRKFLQRSESIGRGMATMMGDVHRSCSGIEFHLDGFERSIIDDHGTA